MKRDGKKGAIEQQELPSLIARSAGLPGVFLPLDPMGALGIPQTPRRSSLIAHSFTSSYAPDRPIIENNI